MAIVTKPIGALWHWDDTLRPPVLRGTFRAEIDYDDATLRVVTVRAVNTTLQPGRVELHRHGDGRSYVVDCLPGLTVATALPVAGSDRLIGTVDERGRLDGFDKSVVWPV